MRNFSMAGMTGLALVLAFTAAHAQDRSPITLRDVVGEWALKITPSERRDVRITFESKDGAQQLDFPLSITAAAGGRLACEVDSDPADCRIRDGRLVVNSGSGSLRMIFTLTDRTREGFHGDASLRLRLLPLGGTIGVVAMTRLQAGRA